MVKYGKPGIAAHSPVWRLVLMILIACGLFAVSLTACSKETNYVMIDQSSKAYRMYIRVPADTMKELELDVEVEGQPGIVLISWEQFINNQKTYLDDAIVKNEYERSKTIPGIVQLLEKYPGLPIGLTWNGGIAFTAGDYKHAEKAFQSFTEDPEQYQQTRNRDPRADPVKPEHHLGPLLGW